MTPQETQEYILMYIQQAESRNEMARLFPLAVQNAAQKGAGIYSNIQATKEIFDYVAHIAERGEKPGTSSNTEAAISCSVFILLLMYGENPATRRKILTQGMQQLRTQFPLPDPYAVPYIPQMGELREKKKP